MEGVLVSAKKTGSIITVTVVSDRDGNYSFPRVDLEPGQYTLRVRAIGYDLDDPGAVEITPKKTSTIDLKVHERAEISGQMSSLEWLNSFPGTQEQKMSATACSNCHTLERIARSHYNADEFMAIFERMATYAPENTPARAQKSGEPSRFTPTEALKNRAEFFSSINLSTTDKWAYPLKALPRPTGRGTHVIYTEYDISRKDSVPHDVALDHDGNVWYADSGWMKLGKLDPRTAKVDEYSLPIFNPDKPVGLLGLEADKAGNLWIGIQQQNRLAKLDVKTMQFTYWEPEKAGLIRTPFVMPYQNDVDGKVWMTDLASVGRLDVKSGQIERFDVFQNIPGGRRGHSIYQVIADSRNNCYFLDWPGGGVGIVDAKTGEVSFYPTPTPNSFSRRGHMDSQDRLWFGEFTGNHIGMFDTHTKTFKEWEVPDPMTQPYDAALDKNGYVWAVGHNSDRFQRLDPKTGEVTQYLLPRYTDARRIAMQDTPGPVTFWIANKNNPSVIKVQLTD